MFAKLTTHRSLLYDKPANTTRVDVSGEAVHDNLTPRGYLQHGRLYCRNPTLNPPPTLKHDIESAGNGNFVGYLFHYKYVPYTAYGNECRSG